MPKIIIQNYRSGVVELADIPRPAVKPVGVIMETASSVISPGTEKMMTEIAKKSLAGKALARPDLVRQFLNKAKAEGFLEAYNLANQRLDSPVALGYSSAGKILEVGNQVVGFDEGMRVAATGALFANHTEISYVPNTLLARIPDAVSYEEAAFSGMGAIALHAVRMSKVTLGETVAVIGLGILGLISVQILKQNGAKVIAMDIDPVKVNMAKKFGADIAVQSGEAGSMDAVRDATEGRGSDIVLVFAATSNKQLTDQILEMAADRARLIVPGVISLDLPRKPLYEKELSLLVSRGGGPGLYDEIYEAGLRDYPINFVRWTASRNMEVFMQLIADKALDLTPLITHKIKFEEALDFYSKLQSGKLTGLTLGVVLNYKPIASDLEKVKVDLPNATAEAVKGKVNVGVIGAGLFTRSILAPSMQKTGLTNAIGVAARGGLFSFHMGRKFGFKYATSNHKQLLEDQNINAIVITTQHASHAGFVAEAINADKHVFVEKPLALTASELVQIEKACADHPKQLLMVGYNRRFATLTEFVTDKMKWITDTKAVHIRVNAGYVPKESWIHQPSGGGRILGEVCHFVDLIQHFTGALPARVHAETMSSSAYLKSDNVTINIKFGDGSIGSIFYVANGPKNFSRELIEVYGGGSVGTIDSFRKAKVISKERTDTKQSIATDLGYQKELSAFLNAIKDGGSSPISLKSLLYTTWTTLAIEESLNKNVPVEIDEFIKQNS